MPDDTKTGHSAAAAAIPPTALVTPRDSKTPTSPPSTLASESLYVVVNLASLGNDMGLFITDRLISQCKDIFSAAMEFKVDKDGRIKCIYKHFATKGRIFFSLDEAKRAIKHPCTCIPQPFFLQGYEIIIKLNNRPDNVIESIYASTIIREFKTTLYWTELDIYWSEIKEFNFENLYIKNINKNNDHKSNNELFNLLLLSKLFNRGRALDFNIFIKKTSRLAEVQALALSKLRLGMNVYSVIKRFLPDAGILTEMETKVVNINAIKNRALPASLATMPIPSAAQLTAAAGRSSPAHTAAAGTGAEAKASAKAKILKAIPPANQSSETPPSLCTIM